MTREPVGVSTILTADADRRRIAFTLHPLRRAAHHIASDCERMLVALHHPDRAAWRDAVGDALVASRHLMAVAAQGGDMLDATHATHRITGLAARMREPQQRIVDAMTRLLAFVPVSADDELLLQDARAVRDAAAGLFAFRHNGEREASRETRGVASVALSRPAQHVDRVLVADDDSSIRAMLRRQIAGLGHDVLLAPNGVTALEMARREQPDLVLTDINMPEMDGVELLERLKGDDGTRHIPVIVISSQDDVPTVVRCIDRGAEDHISKPFEQAILRARVRTTLERKRMRDLEREHLQRVGQLTAAAEAVESERYERGSLAALAADDDALGRLARVFDRMVSGLKSREERLQHRLGQLRDEITAARQRMDAGEAVSDDSHFRSGEILAGRYQIAGQLGKGGMGTVYRARDLVLGEEVAVKVVRRDLVKTDRTILDRLKSEIRLTRMLSHRNVVRAHDFGEWQGTSFISMEYVKGITVAELLDRRGRLSVESTLAIGVQLAEALAVAHEHHVIHRDVKPANLLVDEAGTLKVSDFGIARLMERQEAITLSGFLIGTPQYMAPEQLMGRTADPRSDLFAVGVVLYECLAGRPPFMADAATTLLAMITNAQIIRLSEYVGDVPPMLEALVYQLLHADPRARPKSARELAERLHEIEHATRTEPPIAAAEPVNPDLIELL